MLSWLYSIFNFFSRRKKLNIGEVGSLHRFHIKSAEYKGTYCSVWFDEPNEYSNPNESVPNAPKYYIDFVWTNYLPPAQAKELVDKWLSERGLLGKVAKWEKSYHFKYFYQLIVDKVDGKEVGAKKAELWCEANWDGVEEKFHMGLMEVHKDINVLVGLPHYKDRDFRIVGLTTQHLLGFGIVVLFSDFVHQFLAYKGGD